MVFLKSPSFPLFQRGRPKGDVLLLFTPSFAKGGLGRIFFNFKIPLRPPFIKGEARENVLFPLTSPAHQDIERSFYCQGDFGSPRPFRQGERTSKSLT
jgi:hypothetical protein